MIKIDSNRCTGCGACQNACPKNCISMVENEEGFRYPVIDKDKCVNCNLCEKSCHLYNPLEKLKSLRMEKPKVLICRALKVDTCEKSMTGGIAYMCGKSIIEKGGVVFGAKGNVIDGVYHTKCETIEELEETRWSKYLQSDLGETYKEAKAELKKGRLVLFTGTPCQISGFYSFLGDYPDNLFTLDLICHGVPSKYVFERYVKELEEEHGSKVLNFYRDKKNGARPCSFTCLFENGDSFTNVGGENSFNRLFVSNTITRKSCQKCNYQKVPRVADISVGDYLYRNKCKELDPDNIGLSLISLNTVKGSEIFKEVENNYFVKEISIEEGINESEHLFKAPKSNIFRRTFFSLLRKNSYKKTAKIIIPQNGFHRFVRRIYGVFCYGFEFFYNMTHKA